LDYGDVPESRHILRDRDRYQEPEFDGVYLARKDGDELAVATKATRTGSAVRAAQKKELGSL
jgi:hypothetical protein